MYLSRLKLNQSRLMLNWIANPYRVHQRLCMAFDKDPRLLFRIDELNEEMQILVQSHYPPNWKAAFEDFSILRQDPELKSYNPAFAVEQACRFRLLANPTVKRNGKRYGLIKSEEQHTWLTRKFEASGAYLVDFQISSHGLSYSRKNQEKDTTPQTHFAVLFEGILVVKEPLKFSTTVENGVGSAKGYGFGLLSLARLSHVVS